jgi:hypothetical protein
MNLKSKHLVHRAKIKALSLYLEVIYNVKLDPRINPKRPKTCQQAILALDPSDLCLIGAHQEKWTAYGVVLVSKAFQQSRLSWRRRGPCVVRRKCGKGMERTSLPSNRSSCAVPFSSTCSAPSPHHPRPAQINQCATLLCTQ